MSSLNVRQKYVSDDYDQFVSDNDEIKYCVNYEYKDNIPYRIVDMTTKYDNHAHNLSGQETDITINLGNTLLCMEKTLFNIMDKLESMNSKVEYMYSYLVNRIRYANGQ